MQKYEAPAAAQGQTALGYSFNAALKPVEKRLGAPASEAIKKELGAKRFIDFFRYPAADCYRAIHLCADALAPALGSKEAALHELGESVARDFFDTTMGKTLLTIVGTPDPVKLLNNAPGAYRTTVSWGERKFVSTGPNSGVFSVRGEIMPAEYQAYVVLGAVKHVTRREVQVAVRTLGPGDYDFELTWK